LASRVEKGLLGKKSGEGFYKWNKGKPVKASLPKGYVSPEIGDRMMYVMLNESVQCLAEGIVPDVESLDLGMIFGTGFPPFHGGPMNYIKSKGQTNCETRLKELAAHGRDRFKPQTGWSKISL